MLYTQKEILKTLFERQTYSRIEIPTQLKNSTQRAWKVNAGNKNHFLGLQFNVYSSFSL